MEEMLEIGVAGAALDWFHFQRGAGGARDITPLILQSHIDHDDVV